MSPSDLSARARARHVFARLQDAVRWPAPPEGFLPLCACDALDGRNFDAVAPEHVDPTLRAFVAEGCPGRRPTQWRRARLASTANGTVDLSCVTLGRGRAARDAVFVFKQSHSPVEASFYARAGNVGQVTFPHAPMVYRVFDRRVTSHRRPYAVAMEHLALHPVQRYRPVQIDALAQGLFAINRLDAALAPASDYGFERFVTRFRADRRLGGVRRLKDAEGWRQLDARLDALACGLAHVRLREAVAHGDAHPRNFGIFRRQGRRPLIKFLDWERVSLRPVGTDLYHYLARVTMNAEFRPLYARLLDGYCERVRDLGVDRREVEIAALLGVFQRSTVAMRSYRNDRAKLDRRLATLEIALARLETLVL